MYNTEITIVKTNSSNTDFVQLVQLLDADLKIRDGDEHEFYNQYNAIAALQYVLVAYYNNEAVGCGAIKLYQPTVMEIKRMYVKPEHRGKGIASNILTSLELWCSTLGITNCILETGIKQPEAIALYHKMHYTVTANYGQYLQAANSICFAKKL